MIYIKIKPPPITKKRIHLLQIYIKISNTNTTKIESLQLKIFIEIHYEEEITQEFSLKKNLSLFSCKSGPVGFLQELTIGRSVVAAEHNNLSVLQPPHPP